MVINHNNAALNTYNQLNLNSTAMNKSLQKLSSGYRINSASDDAAGLAISEKMRGQIRGLDKASSNAQDAISMTQTAEGALGETTSILQRMRELAVQSGSDTNTDSDRQNIQDEMDALVSEIDRIANDTEFNTKKLLDGSMGSVVKGDATVTGAAASVATGGAAATDMTTALTSVTDGTTALTAGSLTISYSKGGAVQSDITFDNTSGTKTIQDLATTLASNGITLSVSGGELVATASTAGTANAITDVSISDGTTTISFTNNTTAADGTTTYDTNGVRNVLSNTSLDEGTTTTAALTALKNSDGNSLGIEAGDTVSISYVKNGEMVTEDVTITSDTTLEDLDTADFTLTADASGKLTAKAATAGTENAVYGLTYTVKDANGDSNTDATKALSAFTQTTKAEDIRQDGSATILIGANTGQNMTISIDKMDAASLGVKGLKVDSQESADIALKVIDTATATVSSTRSKLGAIENRLDHTINNLTTSSENLTSAESRIRDVDMASEMSNYTKLNVLNQAATAMLAQANQLPQQVLSLLK